MPTARGLRVFAICCQARATWHNYYEAGLQDGRTCLRLNVDETALRCHDGNTKGNVIARDPVRKRALKLPRAASKRRRFITHVAVLCESKDVQLSLPQFIIGNELTFLKREFEALQDAAGDRIILIRRNVFQFLASPPRDYLLGRTPHGVMPTYSPELFVCSTMH